MIIDGELMSTPQKNPFRRSNSTPPINPGKKQGDLRVFGTIHHEAV